MSSPQRIDNHAAGQLRIKESRLLRHPVALLRDVLDKEFFILPAEYLRVPPVPFSTV